MCRFDVIFFFHRVFNVITFASMSMGRSASMIPNYSKGKESAQRILQLNDRPSQIDPEDPTGIKLVNLFSLSIVHV